MRERERESGRDGDKEQRQKKGPIDSQRNARDHFHLFHISAVFSLVEKIPFFRFDGKNSCRFPNQGQNVVNLIKPF